MNHEVSKSKTQKKIEDKGKVRYWYHNHYTLAFFRAWRPSLAVSTIHQLNHRFNRCHPPLIPILNVSLATKDVISGTIEPLHLVLSYISLFTLAAASIWFCVVWFNREETLFRG